MSLKSTIDNDLKAALLSGDRFKGEVLRSLKAAILNEEVATSKRDEGLDDEAIEKLVVREVKKRAESAAIYESAGRPELAMNEKAEAEILEIYLPEQVSEENIKLVVDAKIAELGVSGPAAMGQVIGAVKKEFGNTADGALIAKLVKDALN